MARSPASATQPRELLSGIDTLDLTCQVPASAGLLAELDSLKVAAGEDRRAAVLFALGDEQFRIMPTGMGNFWPYRLEHKFGQAGLGESPNRPAWRVSPSSEALHIQGPSAVIAFWERTLESLTNGPVVLQVSRLDVHADFASLGITEADLGAFVCRSGRESTERRDGVIETIYHGRGGEITSRIYDKLSEIAATGKGGHVLSEYAQAGLKAGEQVQRVEAQVRREPLRAMNVMSAQDAIDRAGEVFLYVVGKWLRLIDPSSASRRERAGLDPRWKVVQSANIAAGLDAANRRPREQHAPNLVNIIPMLTGLLVAGGTALGVTDYETACRQLMLLSGAYLEDRDRDFAAEVSARRLEFGPF